MRRFLFSMFFCLVAQSGYGAEPNLLLEDMTWQEVANAVKAGKTTVIVPTGGTEQNGPQLALGKHNFILQQTADDIARSLGNALVAPIMPYVPEGDVTPPTGHMRYAGTLSLTPETFAAFLTDTARSLKQHGFTLICFVGEHGQSQEVQTQVAAKLTAEWKKDGVKVLQVGDYYDEHNGQVKWLMQHGQLDPDPEAHAGLADTSEMLFTHPQGVRRELIADHDATEMVKLGIAGSPTQAKPELGKELLRLKVEAAVKEIKAAQQKP